MTFSIRASQVVLVVKNLPANAGDSREVGSIAGLEDLLEEGMATHSSIFAWRIPWTEEPSGLQSMSLQRVSHIWSDLAPHTHLSQLTKALEVFWTLCPIFKLY